MQPGRLRHRVLIQNPEKTDDGMGGYTETWNTVAIRQAAIWNYKGKEKVVAGKLTEETIWNVRIRYYDGIKSGMRLKLGNTAFEILSVAPFEFRRIYQDLSCRLLDGYQQ
jgi:SPP1 family predicted phage head-tail adaptor